jgi:hypothetical protein
MKTASQRGFNLRRDGTAAFLSLILLSLTGCMPPIKTTGGAAKSVTYELNRDTQVWTKTDCKLQGTLQPDYSYSSEGVCFKETLKTPPDGIDGVK